MVWWQLQPGSSTRDLSRDQYSHLQDQGVYVGSHKLHCRHSGCVWAIGAHFVMQFRLPCCDWASGAWPTTHSSCVFDLVQQVAAHAQTIRRHGLNSVQLRKPLSAPLQINQWFASKRLRSMHCNGVLICCKCRWITRNDMIGPSLRQLLDMQLRSTTFLPTILWVCDRVVANQDLIGWLATIVCCSGEWSDDFTYRIELRANMLS